MRVRSGRTAGARASVTLKDVTHPPSDLTEGDTDVNKWVLRGAWGFSEDPICLKSSTPPEICVATLICYPTAQLQAKTTVSLATVNYFKVLVNVTWTSGHP